MIFILGLINLPLACFLFKDFYDRGYALAKIISIAVLTYLVWLLAILKILPFRPALILAALLLIFLFNLFLIRRQPKIKKEISQAWRIFLFEELLFFLGLLVWVQIRSFQPNIHGLEKYMDFGFVNAILRSRYFPPNDMWLAGNSINYYYFGHLETAVLTKLSGIKSIITYNLMLATLCGLILSAGFSVASNLISWFFSQAKKRSAFILGGLISAILLTFGGNLQLIYHWLTKKGLTDYWYPDATRFIVEKFGAADNTIHEFPIYSLVVADLHGHLLNIPHVLLIIGLALSLAQSISSPSRKPSLKIKNWLAKTITKLYSFFFPKLKKKSWLKLLGNAFEESLPKLPLLLALGLSLGIAFMTNAWDYPIHLLSTGAIILWFNYLNNKKIQKTLIKTAVFCLWLLAASSIFILPFYLSFENIAQGLALVDFHSPLWMLAFLWGFPLFVSVCFICLIRKLGQKVKYSDFFSLALLAVSWLLILLPEIFRIKDIYIFSHQRANTMFKLTYQAFIMFRLLSGYLFIRLITSLKPKSLRKAFNLVFLAGAAIILTYPRFAIRSYYNNLKGPQSLDGLNYLSAIYPDDYQAIAWLNQNIKADPVIVEAVGDSYTDYGRVSANTGLPTILGWRVHEWLWRGTYDIPGKRSEQVAKIYTSQNRQEVKNLLNQYQVRFVFVGDLERQAYPNLNQEILASLGEIVFASGKTKIYQIN